MEAAALYQLASSPLEETVKDLIRHAKESLFISAPYIKAYGAETLLANAKARKLTLLTNLSLTNVSGMGFDFESLIKLGKHFEMTVSSLEKLHAKIYIADSSLALVTSANLTLGGLRENYEYGVLIRELSTVGTLQADMAHYFSLGNIFQQHALFEIQEDIREIKKLKTELDQTSQARKLRQALSSKEESFQTKVFINRVRGRTINSIFSETILYLLRRYETLSTKQLHMLIKEIHPD
ncbi:MAG: phospholipase D-like domain-containing protein, partial [Chloroflexota bacterium]